MRFLDRCGQIFIDFHSVLEYDVVIGDNINTGARMKKDRSQRRFTTPEVAETIGRTVHKTIAYVNRGIVKPSIQDADGHGSRRLWSYLDVIRLLLICELEDLGLTVPTLRAIGPLMEDFWMQRSKRWIMASAIRYDSDAERAFAALRDQSVSVKVGEKQKMTLLRLDHHDTPPELSQPVVTFSMDHFHDQVADQ